MFHVFLQPKVVYNMSYWKGKLYEDCITYQERIIVSESPTLFQAARLKA